jgi:hypothetical protein
MRLRGGDAPHLDATVVAASLDEIRLRVPPGRCQPSLELLRWSHRCAPRHRLGTLLRPG